jgi:hypothetical protein
MTPRKCYTDARREWPSSKGANTSTEPAKRATRGAGAGGGGVGGGGGGGGGVPSRCVVIFLRAVPLLFWELLFWESSASNDTWYFPVRVLHGY